MDESVESVRTILQNVVGIPAHNDAGAFVRQLQNHIALNVPQKICGRHSVHHPGNTLGGESIGKKTLSGGVFPVFFYKLGGEAGLHSNLVYQLLVIEGDTQFLRNLPANAAAAAAEFTADGNNLFLHI